MLDVVADSSPLQYLHRLALLDLLPREYGAVLVPEAVVREIEAGAALGADVPDLSTLPWIRVVTLTSAPPQHVDTSLGRGEREVIQLRYCNRIHW